MRVVVYFAASLFSEVVTASLHSSTLASSLSKASGTTFRACLRHFLSISPKNNPEEPEYEHQAELSKIICYLPEDILFFASRSFDDIIPLLSVRNEQVQKAAYICLKRFIRELVQRISLKVEMSGDEDVTEIIPAGLIDVLKSAPDVVDGGVQEKTVLDKEERREISTSIQYLLVWALVLEYFEDSVRS